MPGGPQPVPRAREGSRGTTLSPARPARTPGTGSSDKPLPDPVTTLRPRPAAQRLALPVRAQLAIPRSLPPRRRRRRRSRWRARSAARTNDLEVRQDDGHTRPRGRPGQRIADHATAPEGHLTPREKDRWKSLTQRGFRSARSALADGVTRVMTQIWQSCGAADARCCLSGRPESGPNGSFGVRPGRGVKCGLGALVAWSLIPRAGWLWSWMWRPRAPGRARRLRR